MRTKKVKKIVSLFLAVLMCVTIFAGFGTTAYAAEETDEVYLISFPRDGDDNYGGEWGHGSHEFMNGWSTDTSRYTSVYAMGSYNGNICYCIEIGVPLKTGDRFTKKGENFWDNYPSSYNKTISPDDIKLFIGRIMQYGYTGTISTSWRSQNEGGDKLAHAVATQLLIWETVVGERDADFNKVDTGGKDAILDQISVNHPLRSKIMSYYNSITASVQNHSKVPSFFAKSAGKAQNIELEWDGEKYTATLTDHNNVLEGYSFSADAPGIHFSVSGNKLTVAADEAPSSTVTITAEKKNSQRQGVITWTDGVYGPNGELQDTVTYAQSVSDPVKGYLNIQVSYGSAKIVKTSEDGKVDGIPFRIQGTGVDKTVKTANGGVILENNLRPGIYTVTELVENKYEPQETRRVTVVSGQTSTVTFNIPDIEITCTDSSECFDDNKTYLQGRLEDEPNQKVRKIIKKDIDFLDHIQMEMSTARQFLFIARLKNAKEKQTFESANRIEKTISEQGFEVRRMRKSDIKRFLALYFEASMNGEVMPDIDGEQFCEADDDEDAED